MIAVSVLVLFGRAIELPAAPRLNASLDLALGLGLLLVAAIVRQRDRRRVDDQGPRSPRRRPAAFPFGALSMGTDFTTLALMAPAAKEISTAGVGSAFEQAVFENGLPNRATCRTRSIWRWPGPRRCAARSRTLI